MKYFLILCCFFLISATDYKPLKNEDFNANALNFKGQGASGSCTAGNTANVDLKIEGGDFVLTGGFIILKGHTFGDTVKQQVIDKDNVMGYGANFVLNEFVSNWYVSESSQAQSMIVPGYPAKVLQNLYLRVVYNCPSSNVSVAVNYLLHKIMF